MIVLNLILTALTFILIEWQFWSYRKGDKPHISRGIVAFVVSTSAATINTIVLYRPELLSSKLFWGHIIIGTLFFIGLVACGITGWKFKKDRTKPSLHGVAAYFTRACLYISLLFPLIAHIFR